MKIVADTGPLVAAVDRRDRRHDLAATLVRRLGAYFLIPEVVVGEIDYLLRARVSVDAARAFLDAIAIGELRRVCLDERLFNRAVEYDRSFSDLDLGISDASVMALAERERASVLTFDFVDFRATHPLRGGSWRLVVDERDLG